MGWWESYAVKSMDVVLFTFFLLLGIAVPVFDLRVVAVGGDAYCPRQLVELVAWYARELEDYLVTDKPHFLTALVWLKLLLQWPLCVANLYALAYRRPWFNTACLLFGASFFPAMVADMGVGRGCWVREGGEEADGGTLSSSGFCCSCHLQRAHPNFHDGEEEEEGSTV